MRYDANSPSLIKYQTQGLTGLICSVPASDIARIVNDDPNSYVFDLNIRNYLGKRGNVNKEIYDTCSRNDKSYLFWFLNNGITVVCDKVDPVTDPDDPHVKLTNMQIVNGCQTASSLANASVQGVLQRDTRVLVRIYQTGNSDLVDQIVLTTNNQNRISGRNLCANDDVQSDLEKGFILYELNYERKPRQYDNIEGLNKNSIVPNDIVATAYLGIVLKRCSDARSRKYKVWGEFYDKIFNGNVVQPYVFSSLTYLCVRSCLKNKKYCEAVDERKRYLSKNASFHVARIVSFLWIKTDSWSDLVLLDQQINNIKNNSVNFADLTCRAFEILVNLIDFEKDLNALLKASSLDLKITKVLHERYSGKV